VGHRRRSREYALQVLFQLDLAASPLEGVLQSFWADREADEELRLFTERLVHGVIDDREAIDRRIAQTSEHWRLERMAVVDRNVLRLAVHELQAGETPAAVVIDEAIEVAKRFGNEGSGGFINGLLDRIRVRLEKEAADTPPA
jgi:N utilization substance protein B